MAKYIPTQCQLCGADIILIQPKIKPGDTKSVAKADCLQCGEKHEFTMLLSTERNGDRQKGAD
jgi:hypothetical protein